MNETVLAPAAAGRAPASRAAGLDALCPTIEALGARAAEACSGVACAISWRVNGQTGAVHAPAGLPWRAALAAIFAIAEQQFEHLPDSIDSTCLEPGQLAPLLKERLTRGASFTGIAARLARDDHRVITILLYPVGRAAGELTALARLTNECVAAVIAGYEAWASRDFWMSAGATSGERLAEAKAEIAAAADEQASLERALARCAKLPAGKRFAGLGALFAATGPFDEWIVATSGDDELRVEAGSAACAALPPLGPSGPLAECSARNVVIVRAAAPMPLSAADVGQQSAAFASYVCMPCGRSAIALAARGEIEPAVISRLERLAARFGPLVDKWLVDAEVERLRRLVRSLGLRMFSAADRERQRIARDLHDHHTQLLTAARIALEADPAQTRGILKQLDESLRLHLREIRPATLGRSTLWEGLRNELQRLADAGIKCKVLRPERSRRISRPIQELCYQVAREALSNIIRHSGASRVELSVGRRRGRVVLRIEDNGRGLQSRRDPSAAGKEPAGIGLAGMAERLELMGGRLRIERLGQITQLTAEIPEL